MVAAICCAMSGHGWADETWNAAPPGAADWFTAGNWSPSNVPAATDNVYINNGGTVSLSASSAAVISLNLGSAGSGSSGFAQVSGGTLTTTSMSIGSANAGASGLSQSGGTVSATGAVATDSSQSMAPLSVGTGTGGEGSYTLSAGTLKLSQTSLNSYDIAMAIGAGGGNGTFTLSGTGQLSAANTGVWIGFNTYSPASGYTPGTGTFNQSGGNSAIKYLNVGGDRGNVNSLGEAGGGTGTVNQSGGTQTNALVSVYGHDNSGFFHDAASGVYNLSGGTHTISSLIVGGTSNSATGAYNLQSGGNLVISSVINDGGAAPQATFFSYGALTQTGGSFTAPTVSFLGGTYNLSAGTASIGSLTFAVDPQVDGVPSGTALAGRMKQSGGTATIGSLSVGPGSTYQFTGGSLTVTTSLAFNGGTLDFGSDAVTLTVQPSGTTAAVNFAGGAILNASNASLVIQGANSLTQFPSGFNPATAFASYANAGMTHVLGTPLTIGAGQSVQFAGDIVDPLSISGSLATIGSSSMNLKGGLQVTGSASINLGSGTLAVSTSGSTIDGGTLTTPTLSVSAPAAAGAGLTQTGGVVHVTASGVSGGTQSAAPASLGSGAGASGSYTLAGGTFSLDGGATFPYEGANLALGRAGGTGTFTLSGTGQLAGANSSVWVGYDSYNINAHPNYSPGTGVLNQTGGASTVGYLIVGATRFSVAYAVNGDGGAGTVNQSGGTETNIFVSVYGHDPVANNSGIDAASGIYNLTGGTHTVNTLIVGGTSAAAAGAYNLAGTGQLVFSGTPNSPTAGYVTPQATFFSYGSLTQSGGGLSAPADSVSFLGGTYTLSAGTASIGSLTLGADPQIAGLPGHVQQSGGSSTIGSLSVGAGSVYQFTGGSLTITTSLAFNGGTLDFGSNVVTLTVQPSGTAAAVNFGDGTILNASDASLVIQGANSLTQFPSGFNPATAFASYSNAGITHIVGTPLTINAGQSVQFAGDIVDPLNISGTLSAIGSSSLNLKGGVQVTGSASINLGGGTLAVTTSGSTINGGTLTTPTLSVSAPASAGAGLTQTGGIVHVTAATVGTLTVAQVQPMTVGLGAGNSGSYTLAGGTLLLDGQGDQNPNLALGAGGGSGTFTLSGTGQLTASNSSVGGTVWVGFSVYNSITNAFTLGTGTFIQTGGTSTVTYLIVGSDRASPTVFPNYGGGAGTVFQSGGTQTDASVSIYGHGPVNGDNDATSGVYNLTGGTHTVASLIVGGTTSSTTGAYNLGGSGNLVITTLPHPFTNGFIPAATLFSYGTLTQTGGTFTAPTASILGGTYVLSGGTASLGVLTLAVDPQLFGIPSGTALPGLVQQSGGAATVGSLSVGTGCTYLFTGGSLTVSNGLSVAGGTFDYGGPATASQLLSADQIDVSFNGSFIHGNGPIQTNVLSNSGGSFTQNAGSLTVAQLELNAGSTTVNSGGTLGGTVVTASGGVITVAAGGTLQVGTGGLSLNGVNSPSFVLNADAATPGRLTLGGNVLCTTSAGTAAITNSGSGSPGTVDLGGVVRTFDVYSPSGTAAMNVSATIVDGGIVKTGAGILTLSGPNSLSGGVAAEGGTLVLAAASSFTGGVIARQSGGEFGTMQVGSDAELGSASNTITLAGGTLSVTESFATSRSIIFGDPVGDGTIAVASGATLTLNGPIMGKTGLVAAGPGTLDINTAMTAGQTQVTGGTLLLGPGGNLSNSYILNVGAAGMLDLGSQSRTIQALSGAGTVSLGTGTLTIADPGSANATQFSGIITGIGGIVRTGAGSLTLSGNSTFTGGLTAASGSTIYLAGTNSFKGGVTASAGGTIVASSDAALGDPSNSVSLSGGTLQASPPASSPSITTSRAITVSGTGNTINIPAASSLIASGLLSGSGNLVLGGGGTLRLSAANTLAGPVTLTGGTLALSGAGALKSVPTFSLSSGSTLLLDDSSGNASGSRLATTSTITSNGGQIQLLGASSSSSSESLGRLTVSTGHTVVTLTDGSGPGSMAALVFAGLTITAGRDRGLLFETGDGSTLGGNDRVLLGPSYSPGPIAGALVMSGGSAVAAAYDPTLGVIPASEYSASPGLISSGGTTLSAVPEPGAAAAALGLVVILLRRRRTIGTS
jgi:fibronectin-binding autotransporter adhesin